MHNRLSQSLTLGLLCLGLLWLSACDNESDPVAVTPTFAKKPPPPPPVCSVNTGNELMITHVNVVDDPLRTTWGTDPAVDPRAAAWTFGRVMQKAAGSNNAQAMVKEMFDTWSVDQVVNGQTVTARPKMATKVVNPWLAAGGGALNLKKAPFMLSAIVNRMDLQDLSQNSAGEGRLVFGILSSASNGVSVGAAVIFEFNLFAADQAAVDQWAADWHALGAMTIGSAAYNEALGKIVDKFTGTGSLLRFRTNEAAFDPVTEVDIAAVEQFREFHLNAAGSHFDIVPVGMTPANALDGTTSLANFVNQYEAAILADVPIPAYTVPLSYDGAPFQGGAVFGPPNQEGPTGQLGFWKAVGINNNDARQKFSVNTCNGCHNLPETGTGAVHVFRRKTNAHKDAPAAQLSGFLNGITWPDPVSGVARTFGDLAKRNAAFRARVCP